MLFFPPCKINIGLQILRKRPDGFHDLELSFFALPEVCDILEITPAERDGFVCTGLKVDGEPEKNLVVKARNLLRETLQKQGRTLPSCHIHLHKNIPSGAGLGGGSADAAYTLKGLDRLFQLNLEAGTLQQLAASLGSDCAFFTQDFPCIGQGRGEILKPLQTGLNKEFEVVLAIPGNIGISTAQAYAQCRPLQAQPSLLYLLSQNPENWKDTIENDFERTLFPVYPRLKEIKENFYRAGAVYASMSGSGSAVYGLFAAAKTADTPGGIHLSDKDFSDCMLRRARILIA